MKDELHDSTQWPPPPCTGEDHKHQEEVKLLTGLAWSDVSLSSLGTLLSFSILTNLLFNPWAAAILPAQEVFPSGLRLGLGWSLACSVHLAAWKLLSKSHYVSLSAGSLWAGITAALLWLLIISLMCIVG